MRILRVPALVQLAVLSSWGVQMNTMPAYISIRLRCRLPVVVNGGITTWRLFEDYFGKNGSRLALVAKCLETGESVTLIEGRERYVTHRIANSLTAEQGTIGYRIFRRLVSEGRADLL